MRSSSKQQAACVHPRNAHKWPLFLNRKLREACMMWPVLYLLVPTSSCYMVRRLTIRPEVRAMSV